MADVSVDEAVRTLRTLYEEVRMAHHPGWQINGLRADESNGWIAASAGKGNHGRCVLSVVLDSYRRFATLENEHGC